MGFYKKYKAVFDQVKSILEKVEELKQVFLGESLKLSNLPVAIINPTETTVSQAEIGDLLENEVTFDVVVVIRETEPADVFEELVKPLGKIYDAILADRTLNNTVKDIRPTFFSPGEIRFRNKLYYGGVVRFTAKLFYTPS